MFIIYKAVQGELRRSGTSEQSQKVVSGMMPKLDDVVDMGGHRPWRIVKLETYQANGDSVILAAVVPEGLPVPPASEWTLHWPDYPDRTFNLALTPDGQIITSESHMDGQPMQGRVELAGVDGRPALAISDWVVERVVTYRPTMADAAYAGVYLCHCQYQPLVVAA